MYVHVHVHEFTACTTNSMKLENIVTSNNRLPVLEIQHVVFESVQEKHLDKTIFDQQIVNFVQKTSTVFIYGL